MLRSFVCGSLFWINRMDCMLVDQPVDLGHLVGSPAVAFSTVGAVLLTYNIGYGMLGPL